MSNLDIENIDNINQMMGMDELQTPQDTDLCKLESDLPSEDVIREKRQNLKMINATGTASYNELQEAKVHRKQKEFMALPVTNQVGALQDEFSKLYLYLRARIKSSQYVSFDNMRISQLMKSEDQAIFQMDTFLIIEYIKAAVGVVLEVKFDEIE